MCQGLEEDQDLEIPKEYSMRTKKECQLKYEEHDRNRGKKIYNNGRNRSLGDANVRMAAVTMYKEHVNSSM